MQVSDVARRVLLDTASDAGHVACAEWVAERYRELVTKVKYRHLRKIGELVQPATLQTGTVTVTQGSRTVTPDAAALAVWTAVPDNSLLGRFFRGQDQEWYRIAQFTGGTLTLESPYVVASAAGIGYSIAARYLTLAPDARWLGDFVHMRSRAQLRVVSLAELDLDSPARLSGQGTPSTVAEIGVGPDAAGNPDVRVVEVYPYARVDELLHYVYWSFPRDLKFEDEIPRVIPDYVLKEGAIINAMRHRMAKAIDAGMLEAAAVWRNEYRAQETKWQRLIEDAARADRGVDDVSFIVQGYGDGGRMSPFIRTAHDEVYTRFAGG